MHIRAHFCLIATVFLIPTSVQVKPAFSQNKGDTVIALQRLRITDKGKVLVTVMEGERLLVLGQLGERTRVGVQGKVGIVEARLLQVDHYATERDKLADKLLQSVKSKKHSTPANARHLDKVRWTERLAALYQRELREKRNRYYNAVDRSVDAKKKYERFKSVLERGEDMLLRDIAYHNSEIELDKRTIQSLERESKSYDAAVKSFNTRAKANERATRIHNSRKNVKRTRAQTEQYNREADRYNKETQQLLRELGSLKERLGKLSVRRAHRAAESARLNRQKNQLERRSDDYFDIERPKLRRLSRAETLAQRDRVRAETDLAYMYGGWAWTWRVVGEYERSLEDALQLRRIRPKAPLSYYNNALVRLEQSHPFLAIQQLNEALALIPTGTRALYWRSRAWQQLGQADRAKLDFAEYLARSSGKPLEPSLLRRANDAVDRSTAIPAHPQDPNADETPKIGPELTEPQLLELAQDWIVQRKFQAAALACTRLISKNGKSAIAFSLRGLARTVAGKTNPDPESDFEKARTLDPKSHVHHVHAGFAHAIRGDLQMAFTEFQLALSKDRKLYAHLEELSTKWIVANPADHLGYFVAGAANEIGKNYVQSAAKLYLESFRLRPSPFTQMRLAHIWKGRRPKRALVEITDVIKLSPDNADAVLLRAEIQLKVEHFTKSIEDAANALKISPDLAQANVVRAQARLALKQFRQALADCNRAIQLEPDNAAAYLTRANVHAAQNKHATAIGDYSRAITHLPKSTAALLARGTAYRKINRHEDAVRDLSAAIRLRYGFTQAYLERGMAYAELGDYGKAISDLKRSIAPQSTLTEAHRQLAWIYATASDARWRNGSDAVHYARRACQLTNYRDPRCLEALAAGKAEMGGFKEAARHQEIAITLYRSSAEKAAARGRLNRYRASRRYYQTPKQTPTPAHLRGKSSYALRTIGRELDRKKQYTKAIQAFTASIRRLRANPKAYFRRGLANHALKKRRQAIADYTMAIRYDPKYQLAFYNRAILHNEIGRPDLAIRDYDKSIELNPKHYRSLHGRGYTWDAMKLYVRARNDFEAALKVNSRHKHSQISLAGLLATCPDRTLRNGSKAVQHARRACDLTSWNDSDALAILANAYATAGQFTQAVKWQKEAIKKNKFRYKYTLTARLKLYESGKSYYRTDPRTIDGMSTYAFKRLAFQKRSRQQYQLALEDYARLMSVNPKSAASYAELRGMTHKEQGHTAAALAEFARAKKLSPSSTSPYMERAKIFRERKEYDAAIREYTELLKHRRGNSSALRERATTYSLAGRHKLALADINSLIKKNRRSSSLFSRRAPIYGRMGDHSRALNDYKEALKLVSTSTTKRNSLAWFLATCPDKSVRDAKAAMSHAIKACALGKWSHPGHLDTLAAACAAAGQFNKAIYWQRRAIELAETGRGPLNLDKARKRLQLFRSGKSYQEDS